LYAASAIVGNVLVPPKTRRTVETNQLAAIFRFASTARRFDRATDNWIDGQSLRVVHIDEGFDFLVATRGRTV